MAVAARVEVKNQTCQYMFISLRGSKRVEIILLEICHISRGHLYEPNYIKNIPLCAPEVEKISVHVFTHQPGLVYYILHIRHHVFLFYGL